MWIASKLGFFSAVHKGGAFQIRARVKRDLMNLKEFTGCNAPIIETHNSDYRYRILVEPVAWISIMESLAHTVDYSNFKDMVRDTPGQRPKLEAYHTLWSNMMRLQPARSPFGEPQREIERNYRCYYCGADCLGESTVIEDEVKPPKSPHRCKKVGLCCDTCEEAGRPTRFYSYKGVCPQRWKDTLGRE